MKKNSRIAAIGGALLLLGGIAVTMTIPTAEAKDYVYTTAGGGVGGDKSAKGECITASEKVENRVVKIGSFKGVDISKGMHLEYTYSEAPLKVVVRAPQNLQKYIAVQVKSGMLTVTVPVSYRYSEPSQCPTILVSGRGVDKFKLSGGAQVLVTSTLNAASDVSVEASGGAYFGVQRGMSCDRLSLETSGGATAELNRLNLSAAAVNATGGSTVTIDRVNVTDGLGLTASGGATLNVRELNAPKVAANSSGAATINLSGRAVETTLDASGAATLNAEKLAAQRGAANATSTATVVCNIKQARVSSSSMGKVENVEK